MTTARDLVTRAFRKLGVVADDEPMTADQAEHGLNVLNDMIAAWRLDSVDVSVSELALDDTYPLGREYNEGTIYLLASRLSSDYIVPAGFDADAFFRKIQANNTSVGTTYLQRALTHMPSRYWRNRRVRY